MRTNSSDPNFQPVSKAAWLDRVEADLRGKDPSELNFRIDGKEFTPFHHREDLTAPPPPMRGPRVEPCRSGVSLAVTDPVTDNKVILDLLNKGANALLLHSDDLSLADCLDELLAGVYRDLIDVYLYEDTSPPRFRSQQGTLFQTATTPYAEAGPTERAAQLLLQCHLACARGETTRPTFWTEIGDDYLIAIARLRALRLCYRLVARAYGVEQPCHIVVDPFTKLNDKYGGMISTSVQVAAAVVGGADTVFVPAGEGADEREQRFLRRVALNSYNVLDHEAHLNRVADPAAGSYYLENLTERLARATWSRFQQLSQSQ